MMAAIPPALCIGSFLATVAVRLPEGKGFIAGRSQCPHCGNPLGAGDLIPVASWLFLRGQCRFCKTPISSVYPFTELAAAAVAVWSVGQFQGWHIATACLLGWALLLLSVIDLQRRILPDILTLPLVFIGLLFGAAEGLDAFLARLSGAGAGFALFAGMTFLYRFVRGREGLGLGDAKLAAAAGAWLGWSALPSVVFLAATAALAGTFIYQVSKGEAIGRYTALAFGPYIALSFWIHWMAKPDDVFSMVQSFVF